jgi:hypothetical protein
MGDLSRETRRPADGRAHGCQYMVCNITQEIGDGAEASLAMDQAEQKAAH